MNKNKYAKRLAADITAGDKVYDYFSDTDKTVESVEAYDAETADPHRSATATLRFTGPGLSTIRFTDGSTMVVRDSWGGAEVRVA